jgi:hypothetical protein
VRWIAALVLLAGCDKVFLENRPDELVDAAQIEVDAPDGPLCYGKYGTNGAGLLRLCLPNEPPATWSEIAQVNTGLANPDCTFELAQAGKDLCVIAARDITITAGIRAVGGRALVMVAQRSITIDQTASLDLVGGAGADDKACPSVDGTESMIGAGGGAGGGYQNRGGNGGNGAGGLGAMAAGPEGAPANLHGGCRGGKGGDSGVTGSGGNPGSSGGAIYLIAGTSITMRGSINASGQGGRGGDMLAGGGGGGSGGYIGLDSPAVTLVDAKLVANGGGGGGGGGASATSTGGNGETADLMEAAPYTAMGGPGVGGGAAGGRGADRIVMVGTAGSNSSNGGGGGGGGAGHIRLFGIVSKSGSIQITPNPAEN